LKPSELAEVGVVGEEPVHAGPQERPDLAFDVADAVRVGRRAELSRQELVLPTERPPVHVQPGAVRVASKAVQSREPVQAIAAALLRKQAIPSVAEQMVLLEELAGDEWWGDVTLPMLELARRRIRGLARFVERTKRKPVYIEGCQFDWRSATTSG
jgi:hypothetical protein